MSFQYALVQGQKFMSPVFKMQKWWLFLDLPWRESLVLKGVGGVCVREFKMATVPRFFSSPFF